MAPLLAAAMNHTCTAHPGLRSHLGPNNESFSRSHISSSPQNAKRRCNLSFRPRAERVGSENGVQKLSPSWEIPKRDWFPSDFIFGAATSAYQVLFSSTNVYIFVRCERKVLSTVITRQLIPRRKRDDVCECIV
jgi:hypothetical protein